MRKSVFIVLKRVAKPDGRIIFEEIAGVYDTLSLAKQHMIVPFEEEVSRCRTYTTIQAHVLRTKAES